MPDAAAPSSEHSGPDRPRISAGPEPRWSARDLAVPVAFFLSALLLAVAIAMGPMIGPGLTKLPLSIDQTWVADGSDDTVVLDRCSLDTPGSRVLPARLQQRQRVVAVRPADSDVVTLQAGTALGADAYTVDGRRVDAEQVCAEQTLAATIDRVTLDRRTAAPTGRSSIQYDQERAAVPVPDRRGRTHVFPYGVFPYGFEAAGDYFDVVTRTTVPLHEVGRTQIDGRTVARLRVEIPDTDLGAAGTDPRAVLTRPASWFGTFAGVAPDKPLTASLHHRATREVFVDTATGVVVDQRVRVDEDYRFTADEIRDAPALAGFSLVNLHTTLSGDRRSRSDGADAARARARPVLLTTRLLPLAFGTAGVLILAAGVLVLFRERRRATAPSPE